AAAHVGGIAPVRRLLNRLLSWSLVGASAAFLLPAPAMAMDLNSGLQAPSFGPPRTFNLGDAFGNAGPDTTFGERAAIGDFNGNSFIAVATGAHVVVTAPFGRATPVPLPADASPSSV